MAKKKHKTNQSSRRKASSNARPARAADHAQVARQEQGNSMLSIEAAIPGIAMTAMLVTIFLIAIIGRIDTAMEINVYRTVFRVCDFFCITLGLVFLIQAAADRSLRFDLPAVFRRAAALPARSTPVSALTLTPRLSGWIELLFAAFLVCILISTAINGLSEEARWGIAVRYIGIFNMFAFFLIYMKVSEHLEADRLRHVILLGFLLLSDIIAASAFVNQYLIPIPAYQDKTGISAIFVNSNHFGYFLAMAIVIGIGYWVYENGRWAVVGAASAGLDLIMLVLNNTLGAILAVGICVAGMTILVVVCDRADRRRLQKMLVTAGVFVLGAILAIAAVPAVRASFTVLFADMERIVAGEATGAEGSGRMAIWRQGIAYIQQRPLFGFGCEGITMEMHEAMGIGDVHSEPLTYGIYYGIPALLCYLAGTALVAVRYFRTRRNLPATCRIAFLAASAYFLSSLVGVAMFYTAPFFFLFMGMAASARVEA